MADPNGGNCIPNAGGSTTTLAATGTCNLTAFNNAGQLPGVDVIQQSQEYVSFNGEFRNQPLFFGMVHRGRRLQRLLGRRLAWWTRSSTSPTT